jgi:hypothetical protein
MEPVGFLGVVVFTLGTVALGAMLGLGLARLTHRHRRGRPV